MRVLLYRHRGEISRLPIRTVIVSPRRPWAGKPGAERKSYLSPRSIDSLRSERPHEKIPEFWDLRVLARESELAGDADSVALSGIASKVCELGVRQGMRSAP